MGDGGEKEEDGETEEDIQRQRKTEIHRKKRTYVVLTDFNVVVVYLKCLIDRGERRRPAGSIVVLDQMGDLIHTFSHQLTQKHMELKQFENLVRELTATTQELRVTTP